MSNHASVCMPVPISCIYVQTDQVCSLCSSEHSIRASSLLSSGSLRLRACGLSLMPNAFPAIASSGYAPACLSQGARGQPQGTSIPMIISFGLRGSC